MLFNSIDFLLFFPLVVLVYLLIPKRVRGLWLLGASYYFYMCWNAKYLLLILFSTLVTYLTGLVMERIRDRRIMRGILVTGICLNMSLLLFFKYFDFFLHNLNKVLRVSHVATVSNPFSLLLPVGISFYTFQTLGYMVDVYRGTVKAEKSLLRYALFVSFFPQLVAGPIERSGNLLSQIEALDKKRLWNYEGIVSGFCMMVWGLFQKMVIADRCAIFVDAVYNDLYACGTFETVIAACAFSVQIYCDFAGYSAVAIGAARIMGFRLMENFSAPYFATSIADFWRRWHISLSTWFRDYVYIPLGGSRCSKMKKYRNLMITFLVSGLWHGAAWTYIIWGGIHGFYQIVGDLLKPFRERIIRSWRVKTEVFSFRLGRILTTFCFTTMAWIMFRAESVKQFIYYINRMFTKWNPWVLFDESLFQFGLNRRETGILLTSILILFFVDRNRERNQEEFGVFMVKQNLLFRWLVLIGLVVVTLVLGVYGVQFDSSQFIYFTF